MLPRSGEVVPTSWLSITLAPRIPSAVVLRLPGSGPKQPQHSKGSASPSWIAGEHRDECRDSCNKSLGAAPGKHGHDEKRHRKGGQELDRRRHQRCSPRMTKKQRLRRLGALGASCQTRSLRPTTENRTDSSIAQLSRGTSSRSTSTQGVRQRPENDGGMKNLAPPRWRCSPRCRRCSRTSAPTAIRFFRTVRPPANDSNPCAAGPGPPRTAAATASSRSSQSRAASIAATVIKDCPGWPLKCGSCRRGFDLFKVRSLLLDPGVRPRSAARTPVGVLGAI